MLYNWYRMWNISLLYHRYCVLYKGHFWNHTMIFSMVRRGRKSVDYHSLFLNANVQNKCHLHKFIFNQCTLFKSVKFNIYQYYFVSDYMTSSIFLPTCWNYETNCVHQQCWHFVILYWGYLILTAVTYIMIWWHAPINHQFRDIPFSPQNHIEI